jgi:hypothetical protein
VFVTGYGVESIEQRFANVPIVKKPVQRQLLQRIFVPATADAPAKFTNRRVSGGREGLRRAASLGQS